jgi:hypothetical protein
METTAEPTTGQPTEVASRCEVTAPAEASVLVTEQQVLLSTAAAARRPTTAHRLGDVIRGVATAVLSIYALTATRRPSPLIPPRSRGYYESSLVSRARMRL